MRRLNNITPQKEMCLPVIEDGKAECWQSIITFEHILDGDKLMASPETQNEILLRTGKTIGRKDKLYG